MEEHILGGTNSWRNKSLNKRLPGQFNGFLIKSTDKSLLCHWLCLLFGCDLFGCNLFGVWLQYVWCLVTICLVFDYCCCVNVHVCVVIVVVITGGPTPLGALPIFTIFDSFYRCSTFNSQGFAPSGIKEIWK